MNESSSENTSPHGAPTLSFRPRGLYIDGQWHAASSDRVIAAINPSTGSHLADIPVASDADVDRAVHAADRAYTNTWKRLPLPERARLVEQLADRIAAHREELGLIDCLDGGNTLAGMIGDVDWAVDALRYFAGLITEIKGESSSREPRHLNWTIRQPYGVVGKINPFNHPFRFCAEKAAAALVAGNTVVIKAPEQASLSSLRFGELCADVLPPGVVNVVTGGGETGAALVRHPVVRRIGFVGSVETARLIARDASDRLKRLTLELGGKNPVVIFPDADPARAARHAIDGMNMNRQGQSCSSTSRVLVHESLHEQVVAELVRQLQTLRVDLPWLPATDLGPIVSREQYERVMGFVDSGRRQGAELKTGGGPPEDSHLAQGFFIKPTLFDHVTPAMQIACEEIFGPVMSVMPWSDFDEMIGLANGLDYGLTASLFTHDLNVAFEAAQRLECGYVWINSKGRYLGAPYGGWKLSGLEREECFDELLSYTQVKNINLRWDPRTTR
jgi:betaine-aldehyde dehydrogenase